MFLVLSGEGPSDLGKLSYSTDQFIPGTMYFIIDKIIEKIYKYSFLESLPENIIFIPKPELMNKCKTIRVLPSKKNPQETGLFYKNSRALAQIAKEKELDLKDEAIAIFFRDCDGTHSSSKDEWAKKTDSMENGFKIENFTRGVSMIPMPKSEAWLLCALKSNSYQNCEQLESESGNDDSKNSLKKQLKKILDSKAWDYSKIDELIKNEDLDIEKIDMPSFLYFKKRMETLLN